MATVSVTNTFVNGTATDAPDVNTNFNDLVTFINASVLHADGAIALSGDLSFGSNKATNVATPTAGTDGANKNYVDDRVDDYRVKVSTYYDAGGATINDTESSIFSTTESMPAGWTTANVTVIAIAAVELTSASDSDMRGIVRIDGVDSGLHRSGLIAAGYGDVVVAIGQVNTTDATINISFRGNFANPSQSGTLEYGRFHITREFVN